ncbi:unnamed protein product [Rotaria magnacalcarata]|uniref:EamA domain-containing protein n=2 Tax=Rotaria magnacalcarata TaxID=392030 RepID=A0A819NIB6_9BILA|nr:unnamed protein product [Rotaria magnacalcarata]CAF3999480.1 unnamed protein product [Rotaria magnacalcarata]
MMAQHQNELDEFEPTIIPSDPLILIPAISKENLEKETTWTRRFSGIFYTLFASFLFVSATFTIKKIGVDLLDALLLRMILQATIMFSFVVYNKYTLVAHQPRELFLQILCASTDALGFFLYFLAVRYVELSDVNTLAYTRVVWTVVLSVIVYRERPSIGTLLALPLTLLGVVLVTQPTFLFPSAQSSANTVNYRLRVLGFIMAITCALTSALNVLSYKQLISTSKQIKPSVINFQFSFTVCLFLIANQFYKVFYLKSVTSLSYFISWPYLLSSIVCLISILGSILIQKGIKREHPAVFSLLSAADIIYALILQNIFTSVRSNFYALLGSALIISSVVLIGISKIMNERARRDKIKRNNNANNENEKC